MSETSTPKLQETLVHTEPVDLPSKGYFYPTTHPLSSGRIEIFAPTAYHEDILTSANLIQKGTVIEKFLEALIATKGMKYEDLLIGDKDALFVAARILAYGRHYEFSVKCPKCEEKNEITLDLQSVDEKPINESIVVKGKNEFMFVLPISKKTIIFKLLTQGDENGIQAELDGIKRATKAKVSPEITTRLRRTILSIDGETDSFKIKQFVDNMPARDARAFREYVREITPGMDMKFDFQCDSCDCSDRLEVPIEVTFLWPDARV